MSVINKLITHEDPCHIHKTLAFLVTLSYLFRFSIFIYTNLKILYNNYYDHETYDDNSHIHSLFYDHDNDMGFTKYPQLTIPTILLHLSLNLSSFVFKIPKKRITTDGGRIWPEYRLHALFFTSRSISCILINWLDPFNHNHHHHPSYWYNLLSVYINMIASDIASRTVQYPSQSIRDLKAPTFLKYTFSTIQFFATAIILLGFRHSSTIYFYQVFVIQITAFIMTLRRKNIVSHTMNVWFYTVLLLTALLLGYCQLRDSLKSIFIIGFTAAFWRLGFWWCGPIWLRNKYLIWISMYFLSCRLRYQSF